MKILVVCQYYYPEPFRITDICEELVKRGHQITVLTGLPNYPEGRILKEYRKKEHRDEIRNGVRIIRCNEHGRGKNAINMLWNYFSFAFSGKRKVRKLDKDFDVVFINQLSPIMMAWPGIKYAKEFFKKSVLYCYDLWPASLSAGGIKKGSIIYQYFRNISKRIYNNVDHICVTSKSFSNYLVEEHGTNKDKISYLPQYCEELFDSIDTQPHKGINFVFAGNIGQMQSVQTIIRAATLIKGHKGIKIHIVGDGRDLVNCKNLAIELKADNVIFYGRRPLEEMPKFYAMADAMLVTLAKDELVSKTLPGKVQSYMAAGKPIIAAIDGEGAEIIQEADCGFVCEAENYHKLAELLISFLCVDKNRLSTNSLDFYKNRFSKDVFYHRLDEVLNEVLKGTKL
ncbi:MAG TPA: glycosyltransferase family 4 protein [Bacilli bacterium]|nr:glycosyltransferase family 4 protein [Bacilli bacterium]